MGHFAGAFAMAVPDHKSSADRTAGIPRRGLQISVLEQGAIAYLAVRNRIVGAAAGKRDRSLARASLQRRQQIEEGVFIDRLRGPGEIAVTIGERLVGAASRSQGFNEVLRVRAPPQVGSPPCHS